MHYQNLSDMISYMPARPHLKMPATASYAAWDEFLGSTEEMTLGHNTVAIRQAGVNCQEIAIILHQTQIVRFVDNGAIHVNTGGWNTPTTRNRMNAFLPLRYRVRQRDHQLYLADRINDVEHEFDRVATIFGAVA